MATIRAYHHCSRIDSKSCLMCIFSFSVIYIYAPLFNRQTDRPTDRPIDTPKRANEFKKVRVWLLLGNEFGPLIGRSWTGVVRRRYPGFSLWQIIPQIAKNKHTDTRSHIILHSKKMIEGKSKFYPFYFSTCFFFSFFPPFFFFTVDSHSSWRGISFPTLITDDGLNVYYGSSSNSLESVRVE